MLKHRHIDKICFVVTLLMVALIVLFVNAGSLGLRTYHSSPGYASRLFDMSYVHSIDLVLNEADWQGILENPRAKEYVHADVFIDGDAIFNVGLRVKGNNSLNQIHKYGSKRFSLKIEFDHYEKGQTYFGLDKLSLNTSFQDNAFLKDTMTYEMMREMKVPAPLTSHAFIRVNDRDWGLFVAIEEIEDAFIRRNYGMNRGELYKPKYRRLTDQNDDIALIYTGDEFWRYDNIFRHAVFKVNDADKTRLIDALKILAEGKNLEKALDDRVFECGQKLNASHTVIGIPEFTHVEIAVFKHFSDVVHENGENEEIRACLKRGIVLEKRLENVEHFNCVICQTAEHIVVMSDGCALDHEPVFQSRISERVLN
jgi:hypothetical protein